MSLDQERPRDRELDAAGRESRPEQRGETALERGCPPPLSHQLAEE